MIQFRKASMVMFLFSVMLLIGVPAKLWAAPGFSQNSILTEKWRHDYGYYSWGYFGASPAIADLNGAAGLEIVSGSDGMTSCASRYGPSLNCDYSAGLWRVFDAAGNIVWARSTHSDEARGDPVIVDLNGDNLLEIIGGTTSGHTLEVMDTLGNFVWTFPSPPIPGAFEWDAGPAAADADASVSGVEVFAANRAEHAVYALDGDNSDGVDDGQSKGTTWNSSFTWNGIEGKDWDVLWRFEACAASSGPIPMIAAPASPCEIYSTPAIGDVDNDGQLEVVFGATDGVLYVLNAVTGVMETSYHLGGAIYASPALGNIDGDPYLEIVIGSATGVVSTLQWDGVTASTEWTFPTAAAVYSSAAIGDIDGDGFYEVVVGSNDSNVYALSASGMLKWNYATGGAVYSSPGLANRSGAGLATYIGSEDGFLYALSGAGVLIDRFETFLGGYYFLQGIHTSPSIADVDGDGKLDVFFYDWGNQSVINGHMFWAVEDSGSSVVPYSIEWGNFRKNPDRSAFYEIPNLPPVADAGVDQTVECTGASSASVTLDGSASSDPDTNDTLTYSWSGPFGTATGVSPAVSMSLGVNQVVTLTVDDGNGHTASDEVLITVQDTTPPSVSAGSDVTLEATSVNGAEYDVSAQASASDTCCSANLTAPALATYPLGPTMVNVSAVDCAGNSASDTMIVTVQDTTPPVITPPADVTVEATGPLTPVSIGTATATDIFPVTITNDALSAYPVGTTVVTWTATDANGNSSTATQNVNVVDTTPPMVTAQLIPLNVDDDKDEDEHHSEHYSEGLFRVVFTVSDIADPNPAVTATLNGQAVSNGQIVKLEMDDEAKAEFEHGQLEIKGMIFTLNVSVADASGNTGTASDAYAFPSGHGHHGDGHHKSEKHDKDD